MSFTGHSPFRVHTRETRAQYFYCAPESSTIPIRWTPPKADAKFLPDCRYYGLVLEALEGQLEMDGLDVFVTWDLNRLPWYGPNVVAVVLGDEWGRIPRYTHRVAAIFKTQGVSVHVDRDVLSRSPAMIASSLVKTTRDVVFRTPSAAVAFGHRAAERVREQTHTPIWDVPLGYWNLLDLPPVPFTERDIDISFVGSVTPKPDGGLSPRRLLATPRSVARSEMLAMTNALREARPDVRLQIDIGDLYGGPGGPHAAAQHFSNVLARTRISLCPRGSAPETARLNQSLRVGAIPICEQVPETWFMQGAPVLKIDRWDRALDTIGALLSSPGRQDELHRRCMAWWETRCSERVVGGYMAERLNELLREPRRRPVALTSSK